VTRKIVRTCLQLGTQADGFDRNTPLPRFSGDSGA
jgi:hypothetical protein